MRNLDAIHIVGLLGTFLSLSEGVPFEILATKKQEPLLFLAKVALFIMRYWTFSVDSVNSNRYDMVLVFCILLKTSILRLYTVGISVQVFDLEYVMKHHSANMMNPLNLAATSDSNPSHDMAICWFFAGYTRTLEILLIYLLLTVIASVNQQIHHSCLPLDDIFLAVFFVLVFLHLNCKYPSLNFVFRFVQSQALVVDSAAATLADHELKQPF